MEGTSTRQRALEAALELFSQKGYNAASMADIADALGIKAPSLYKHFKGKEELYAALGPVVDEHYRALWDAAGQRHEQLEQELRVLGLLSVQRLEQDTLAWFQAELLDPQAASMRRLMALGPVGAMEPDYWLWTAPVALYEGLFDRLISREVLRRGEPHVMAVEFLAPLVQLLAMAGRRPDRAETCLEEARAHIRQFHRVFAHREAKGGQTGVGRLFRR